MADAIDPLKILGSLLGNGALSKGSGGKILATALGSIFGGDGQKSGGGLSDMLGGLLGGGQQKQTTGGGVSGMLGGLLGGGQKRRRSSGDGFADLFGGLLGGGKSKTGGLGGLIEASVKQYTQSQNRKAPDTSHKQSDYLPKGTSHAEASDQASLMIRAMINAAKADGSIDQAEQEKIVGKLGNISQAEAQFVRDEFAARLDVDEFVNSVPRGVEEQVYAVSLMAIDLDTNPEAQYLHQLAQGLNISKEMSNQIHDQIGAPKLYG